MSIPDSLIRLAGSVACRSWRGRKLSILIYHRVLPVPDPMRPDEVDLSAFSWQMEVLAELFNVVPLLDAVRMLRQNSLPPRAVCITFDDGYSDNEAVAAPVLRRLGLPATFFIATGFLDGGLMWNDSVIEAVRAADPGPLVPHGTDLPEFELADAASRVTAIEALLPKLKYLAPKTRGDAVARIVGAIGKSLPKDLMMTSAQVRALHDAGMEIGAHTVHHPILGSLGEDAARREIADSRAAVEDIVGSSVALFAYPNGKPRIDYGRRDVDLVRELGFDAAVSTAWGVSTAGADAWQLPRFTPWDRTRERFALRLLMNCGRTTPGVA